MSDDLPNESFNRLLAALAANHDDAAVAYAQLRDSLVRFFRIKGDYDPDDAADATLDRVQSKLSQNTEIENLSRYSFGIARFIWLERIKAAHREKNAGVEFYSSRETSEPGRERDDFSYMRECFESLADSEKVLLRDYFADKPFSDLTAHRDRLATEYGISTNNLRLRIFRLRQRLENCVKEKS